VLEEQRKCILSSCSRVKDNPDQLLLELGDIADAEELKAVRHQVSDNWRYWEQRLGSIDTDLEREPERIRRTFALQTPGWNRPARSICGRRGRIPRESRQHDRHEQLPSSSSRPTRHPRGPGGVHPAAGGDAV